MKIFLDTANINEIRRFAHLIDGITTNPTLIAKEKRDFNDIIQEILEITNKEVCVEVIATKSDEMIKEAEDLSKLSKNIIVKIPMTADGLKAVKELHKKGIKTNVTLVFSVNQALLAAKVGADYVSPFIGRLDDIGKNGILLVRDILDVYKKYNFKTQVITASIRHPEHVVDAAIVGSHVATIPPDVLEKMFKHELTDKGLKKFLDDWNRIKK